jgi:hypothetical protein
LLRDLAAVLGHSSIGTTESNIREDRTAIHFSTKKSLRSMTNVNRTPTKMTIMITGKRRGMADNMTEKIIKSPGPTVLQFDNIAQPIGISVQNYSRI